MKLKTLITMLNDYDENDTVKIDDDCLLIGGAGGFLIKLPKKTKPKTKPKPKVIMQGETFFPTYQDSTGDGG